MAKKTNGVVNRQNLEIKLEKWQSDILDGALEFMRQIENGCLSVFQHIWNRYLETRTDKEKVKDWLSRTSILIRYDKNKNHFFCDYSNIENIDNIEDDSDKLIFPIDIFSSKGNGYGCGKIANRVFKLLNDADNKRWSRYTSIITSDGIEKWGQQSLSKKVCVLKKEDGSLNFKEKGKVKSFYRRSQTGSHFVNWNFDFFDAKSMSPMINLGFKTKTGKTKLVPVIPPRKDDIYKIETLKNIKRKTEYIITKKIIRGRERWYISVCCSGSPYNNRNLKLGKGQVGLDIGTSTIAISSDEVVRIDNLPMPKENRKKKNRLQRAINRSIKLNNPDCFDENGVFIKGCHPKKSKRCVKLIQRLSAIKRRETTARTMLQGTMANQIVSLGNVFITEADGKQNMARRAKETKQKKDGTYASKKRFGKTILDCAPSTLKEKIRNRAKFLGGELIEADTYVTAATKYDHTNESFNDIKLKDRRITLSDGTTVQRDMHSAYNLQHLNVAKRKDWEHVPEGQYKEKREKKNNKVYKTTEMKKHFEAYKIMEDKELSDIECGKKNVKISVVGEK